MIVRFLCVLAAGLALTAGARAQQKLVGDFVGTYEAVVNDGQPFEGKARVSYTKRGELEIDLEADRRGDATFDARIHLEVEEEFAVVQKVVFLRKVKDDPRHFGGRVTNANGYPDQFPRYRSGGGLYLEWDENRSLDTGLGHFRLEFDRTDRGRVLDIRATGRESGLTTRGLRMFHFEIKIVLPE